LGLKTIDHSGTKKAYVPGPGSYEFNKSKDGKIKQEPSFSIGTGMRQGIADVKESGNSPGPGNYNTFYDGFTKKVAPHYVFGTGTRDDSHDKSRAG